jgi:hypothetical protein
MKTLGLLAVTFYLVLTVLTHVLLQRGGHPLEALAKGGAEREVVAAVSR